MPLSSSFPWFGFGNSSSWSQDHTPLLSSQIFDKYQNSFSLKDIEGVLNLEQVALSMTIEALQDYQKGQLHLLDAHTGDTCCQGRAHKILAIDSNQKFNEQELPQVKKSLAELQLKLQQIRESLASVFTTPPDFKMASDFKNIFRENIDAKKKGIKNPPSIGKILINHYQLHPPLLSEDVLFIVLSHLVAKYHSEISILDDKKNKILSENFLGISLKTLQSAIDSSRTKLGNLTNNYVGNLGTQVVKGFCDHDLPVQLSSQQVDDLAAAAVLIQEVGGFPVAKPRFKSRSTYASLKLIMPDFWRASTPIMLKSTIICPHHGLHKQDLIFVKGDQPMTYQLYEGDPQNLADSSVIVIEGVTDLTQEHSGSTFYDLTQSIEKLYEKNQGFAPLGAKAENCPLTQKNLQKIETLGPVEIVYAAASKHTQYVDKTKAINFQTLSSPMRKKQEDQYNYHCQQADQQGLCQANMATFNIVHFFPAKVSEALGKVQVEIETEFVKETE